MRWIVALMIVLGLCGRALWGGEHYCPHGHCHGSVAHECVTVPDVKTTKKVVYEVKCVPVCIHRPSRFLHCDCCPICDLKYKRVLVKREISTEICTTKCVPVELPCN